MLCEACLFSLFSLFEKKLRLIIAQRKVSGYYSKVGWYTSYRAHTNKSSLLHQLHRLHSPGGWKFNEKRLEVIDKQIPLKLFHNSTTTDCHVLIFLQFSLKMCFWFKSMFDSLWSQNSDILSQRRFSFFSKIVILVSGFFSSGPSQEPLFLVDWGHGKSKEEANVESRAKPLHSKNDSLGLGSMVEISDRDEHSITA